MSFSVSQKRNPICDKNTYVISYKNIFVSSIGYRILISNWTSGKAGSNAHYEKETYWSIACISFTFLTFKNKINLVLRNDMCFLEWDTAILAKMSKQIAQNWRGTWLYFFWERCSIWQWSRYDLFTFHCFYRFVFLLSECKIEHRSHIFLSQRSLCSILVFSTLSRD